MLFPPTSDILKTSLQISAAVARVIFDAELQGAEIKRPDYDDHIIKFIEQRLYHPFYA